MYLGWGSSYFLVLFTNVLCHFLSETLADISFRISQVLYTSYVITSLLHAFSNSIIVT